MKPLLPILMPALTPLVLSGANPSAALAPNERRFPADGAVPVWVPGVLSIHRAPGTGFRCLAAGPPPK